MEGKEAIISGIEEKAEREARGLIDAAQAEREELLESVRAEEERKQAAALELARTQAEAVVSRRETVSGLETRKRELAARREAIDSAYEEALKKFLNMTDHIYREFVAGLIEKYADYGDGIVIAERDAKRLHDDWLSALNAKTGKNLAFASYRHGGKGGVILSGKDCDKNLTLETMVKALKENTLTQVDKRLFGSRSKN